jgi:hypothetical protein
MSSGSIVVVAILSPLWSSRKSKFSQFHPLQHEVVVGRALSLSEFWFELKKEGTDLIRALFD